MDQALLFLALFTVVFSFLFTLDDLFIDAVAFFKSLKPLDIDTDELAAFKQKPQKRVAILIANWKEHQVLAAMIRGNLRGIDYQNYTFFLGVYPNDPLTWQAARDLEELFPHKVTVVVNPLPGPTSKGQMLNEIARHIVESEIASGQLYDLFLMQDSEDVLHPHSLSVLNAFSDQADFIQIPVFSFDRPLRSLVGGIYIDEFSEAHTKDLLVREHLGAAIPSAGVGTVISRSLMKSLLSESGHFLKEDTLTEDYHLGLSTKPLGFVSRFLCVRLKKENGQKEFIATREYFPDRFMASIRQKTRWTLGIAYQGLANLQWQGSLVDRYFMMRDRRSPLNSVLIVLSTLLFMFLLNYRIFADHLPAFLQSLWFQVLVAMNMLNMFLRIVQRMKAVSLTTSWRQASLVPVRWLVANAINVAASYRAYRQFRLSQRTGEKPAWSKTDHQLPAAFGQESHVEVTTP